MNNNELSEARTVLMITVTEAAKFIGGVCARSWQYWENGKFPVPGDVEAKMLDLMVQRIYFIELLGDLLSSGAIKNADALYYRTYDEYLRARDQLSEGPSLREASYCKEYKTLLSDDRGVIDWRVSQSVAAHIYSLGVENIT